MGVGKDGPVTGALKPSVAHHEVQPLLALHFNAVAELTALRGGETSQAFAFHAADQEWVVRVCRFPHGFERDHYAWQHFASPDIPIPKVRETGAYGDLFFAISERLPGRDLWSLPEPEHRRVLPLALDMLDRIHAIDVAVSKGYGEWTTPGQGCHQSWRQFLTAPFDKQTPQPGNGQPGLLANDQDLIARIAEQVQRLTAYCPEQRWLLHGDYGYDNVLTDGQRITGVLDWANAGYGDYLYDIAWVGFWPVGRELTIELARRYGGGPAAEHYAQRIACYQCLIGLGSLHFFAQGGREAPYRFVRDRLDGTQQNLAGVE